jgi:hypothetical protein
MNLTSSQIKEKLGNFEREWNENKSGKLIVTSIGVFDEGILNWMINNRSLKRYELNNKEHLSVILPNFRNFREKEELLNQLISIREYAKRKEIEALDRESLTMK